MLPDLQDTIVALSSAPGPGARAVVRLSGPQAIEIAGIVFRSTEPVQPGRRCCYAGKIELSPTPPLPADLYAWPAPRTYTGQELVELHTVSCPPLLDVLIARLLDAGARAAQRGEFTLRAFLAGKLDLSKAEAVLGVIEAGSRQELQQALAQLAGGLSQPLVRLRDDLLDLLAEVEAGLDFAEEDIRFVGQKELLDRLARGLARLKVLQQQLDQRALADRPFRAVLIGRPNAGKSSLFNALGGEQAALVSAEPGTTRDYLECRLTLDGVTVELVDTAGRRESTDPIESAARGLGEEQGEQADLLLLCLEAGRPPDDWERGLFGNATRPVLAVSTKGDQGEAVEGLLATSAVSGLGLDELRRQLAERARAHSAPPLAPSLSRCRHHVVAGLEHLKQAHAVVLFEEPAELLALELRGALDQLGEMVGAVYTDDLLDRIFSRFCIGK